MVSTFFHFPGKAEQYLQKVRGPKAKSLFLYVNDQMNPCVSVISKRQKGVMVELY